MWNSAEAWKLDGENLFRHEDAHYWLPSVNEWYKAAYYDPTTSTYLGFPTGTTTPTPVAGGTGAGTAVYDQQQGPADIDNAGGLSKFGTMSQGGNASEWQETAFDLVNDLATEDRTLRGGAWIDFLLDSPQHFVVAQPAQPRPGY